MPRSGGRQAWLGLCCDLHVDGHVSCWGKTPIEGADTCYDETVLASPFPIAAGGIQFPATSPAE